MQRTTRGRSETRTWACCVAMVLAMPALAQVEVPISTLIEASDSSVSPSGVAIWRNAADPDSSLVFVAEGVEGLSGYGLDGTRVARWLDNEVRQLAVADAGAECSEGAFWVATVEGPSGTLRVECRSGVEAEFGLELQFLDTSGRYQRATSLAFSRGADGRLSLFVAIPNEVDQLVFDPDSQEFELARTLALLGTSVRLSAEPSGTRIFAVTPEQGVTFAPASPETEPTEGFIPYISSAEAPEMRAIAVDGIEGSYLLALQSVQQLVQVFDLIGASPSHEGSFRWVTSDGASPAMSLLALNPQPFGEQFPEGLLVLTPTADGPVRAALLSWGDVARGFDPALRFVEDDGEPDDGGDGGTDGGTGDGGVGGTPPPRGPDTAIPLQPRDPGGCGCTSAAPFSALALVLMAGVLLRRRRRA